MKFALLGEKLSHSYSPQIHTEIFKDLKIDASYELKELKKEELKNAINDLRLGIYSGYNVTIPYKKEVMQYLDEISDEAKAIGAVNTIAYKDGKVIGYNTDYYGFYNELLYFNINPKGRRCYVLGTGGASLAVSKALSDLGGKVTFVSRNPKDSNTISYDELNILSDDIIVNTTPLGMYPNIDASPLDKNMASKTKNVLDIIFNPRQTKLLKYASSNMDGLYMLIGQAIKAEEIWHERKYNLEISELLKRIEAII